MPKPGEFRVLIATDGSRHAQAAIRTAVNFPWPKGSRVRVVIGRDARAEHKRTLLLEAIDRGAENAARRARRALAHRWPDVEVTIVDRAPVAAILDQANRFAADVIVLGWRGHGKVRRLLMGSVSRAVVRGARTPVLVVRQAKHVRTIVVGYDESDSARRAVTFVAGLAPPHRGRVTLVRAVELIASGSWGGVQTSVAVAREIRRTNTLRSRAAIRGLQRAAMPLTRGGWGTATMLATGEPLHELLRAVATARADLLVVGANGVGSVQELPLGSVAEGALSRSPVPVLIAR
jgi:nucleotide-binding universal stress UspA family protein